jgi:hypothetical protein
MNEIDINKLLIYKELSKQELIDILINKEFELINLKNKFDNVVSAYNCVTNNYNGEPKI